MTVYVLETNSTGTGLDIVFSSEFKVVLVTEIIGKYRNDLNFDKLGEVLIISRSEFANSIKNNVWQHGVPIAIVSNSDAHVLEAATISQKLGLPCPEPEIFIDMMNKEIFRNIQAEHGLPHPYFHHISKAEYIDNINLSYPVICKPTQGTGSIGVKLCKNRDELLSGVSVALAKGRSQLALVEQYVVGPLYSAELLCSSSDSIVILGITDRSISPPPYFVETSFTFPVFLSEAIQSELIRQISKIWKYDSSMMLHVEFIIDQMTGDLHFVEINPRVGGVMISRMISESIDRNVFDIYIYTWMQKNSECRLQSNTGKAMTVCLIYPWVAGNIYFAFESLALFKSPFLYHWKEYVVSGDFVEIAEDFKGPLLSFSVIADCPQLTSDIAINIEQEVLSCINIT